MLSLAFNHMDRYALALAQESIKHEFHLTDTELGLLSGIAFALFYSVMGIPIARWADRGNRVRILALTTALWSVMVAVSGFAANFAQLLMIRIGVSVGEAGCVPPAHSLIPDYFIRAERPRAAAIYALGSGIGGMIGFFLAGWLNELYGWRVMFKVLSVPGVALALLVAMTLKEPREQRVSGDMASRGLELPVSCEPPPRVGLVCRALWYNVTFRHLLACLCAIFFVTSGVWQWQATFFIRTYGMSTGDLGTWLALISGVSLVGIYLGGELMSRYAANRERLQLKVMALLYLTFGPLSSAVYLVPNRYLAFALLSVCTVGSYAINGPLFAMMQTLIPARMRAISIAIVFLFANLVGLGLGPLAAGALSDELRHFVGAQSLRYTLVLMCLVNLCVALELYQARKSVSRDLELQLTNRGGVDSTEMLRAEACQSTLP